MTFTIPPDSPKAAFAQAFGNELVKASLTTGVPFKELERVTGVGHTAMDNYRRGYSLPKTEVAGVLAETLHWPRLRDIVVQARTDTCRRAGCGRTFRNEGGSPKVYCSEMCRRIAENLRIAATRIRQGGQLKARTPDGVMTENRRKGEAIRLLRSGMRIADERALLLQQSVDAMCRGCEPEGVCRTEECPLRNFSPLPLAKHDVGEPRTSFQIHAAGWTPKRRQAFAAAMTAAHADPERHAKMDEARTRGQKRGYRIGLAKAHARSKADMRVASKKAWATRRARGKVGPNETAFTSDRARVVATVRQNNERRQREAAAKLIGTALYVGRDRRATPDQRREIARLYHVEQRPPSELALATGLTSTTIWRIAASLRDEFTTSAEERAQAIEKVAAETDDQLRHDLAYWAVAVADHEKRYVELTNQRADVTDLFQEAQAWVRIVTDELAQRRENARARSGPS
jgi:hypothetical protein